MAWGASGANFLNEFLAILLIACMSAPTLGPPGTAVCIAIIGAMAAIGLRAGRIHWRPLVFLALPLFAVASTLWSGAPLLTLKYALQLLITVTAGLLLAMLLSPRGLVRGVLIGGTLVCILSVIDGTMGPSTHGPVLTGLAGSKNAMSSAAHIVVLAGIAALFDRRQPTAVRFIAIPALIVAIKIIATGQAATLIILTVLAVPLYLALFLYGLVPIRARLPILLAALAIATPVAVIGPQIAATGSDYVFRTFNKDKSLTGRTYLWSVADQLITERPILGFGYKYIWMSATPAATGMLRAQRIKDPRSFSMHHSYREIQVDLGAVGLAILILMLLAGSIWVCIEVLFQADWPSSFLFVMTGSLIARSFFETLVAPFYVYCAILFAIIASPLVRRSRVAEYVGNFRSPRIRNPRPR
jgi:exopolysaccharide production protein ExoQ